MFGTVNQGAATPVSDFVSLLRIIQNPQETSKLISDLNEATNAHNAKLKEISEQESALSARETNCSLRESLADKEAKALMTYDQELTDRELKAKELDKRLKNDKQALDKLKAEYQAKVKEFESKMAQAELKFNLNDLDLRQRLDAVVKAEEAWRIKLSKLQGAMS